jgi:hypothetical protein
MRLGCRVASNVQHVVVSGLLEAKHAGHYISHGAGVACWLRAGLERLEAGLSVWKEEVKSDSDPSCQVHGSNLIWAGNSRLNCF